MASESLMQKMQARLAKLESQQNRYIKIKEGLTRLRILPSWRGADDEFFLEVLQHYDVTPDVKALICPMTVGESCPIDRRVAKWSTGDSQQQARAERVAARSQFMMNAIVIAQDLEPEVKLYQAPRGVLTELLSYYTDPEYGDFTDPREGFDVIIRREGVKLNTKYTVRLARKPSRVPLKDWKDHLINLDKRFQPKPREEILRLLGASTNGNGEKRRPRRDDPDDIPE